MSHNDEIFKFIQNTNARLNDPERQAALRAAQSAPDKPAQMEGIKTLSPDQIVSDIYIVSPVQLELVIDYVAKNLAVGMNIKAMYPMIKRLTDKHLKEALAKSKRLGTKRK
ncbi:MAG: hypothetical protein FWD33_02705 [Alphaproteobacteria bacterium]|nr:hypothetical protein [Alphaproteobacteria bacterium]